MTKKIFIMAHDIARARAIEAVKSAPHGYAVSISEPNRTLDQNAAQWPILEAFARNLLWPVNGEMVAMTKEEWKDVLTAGFKKETVRVAMGVDGGMVMLGQRTSKFNKKQFSDWLEYLHWFAGHKGVDISERVV